MHRFWKFVIKRKPPTAPHYTHAVTKMITSQMLEIDLQSIVQKRFVICQDWQRKHAPEAPPNPHPWCVLGVHRESIYNVNVVLMMAPFTEDGFPDVSQAIRVPAGKVGVAAKQA